VAKDRAAPFSRKHRRYWIPVTGGMLMIGVINIALGVCSYEPPNDPRPIQLVLPGHDGGVDAAGTLGIAEIPAVVMRAFAVKYPKTIPAGASVAGDTYTIAFPAGAPHKRAVFRVDGSFVSDE
jgi:hypothetical protein